MSFEYLFIMLGDTFFEDMVTVTNKYEASKGYFNFINSFIHLMFIIIMFMFYIYIKHYLIYILLYQLELKNNIYKIIYIKLRRYLHCIEVSDSSDRLLKVSLITIFYYLN